MTFDERALRVLILGAWSAFLLWLWLSGEVVRYLGPRTEWVATVGGIALAATAVAYAWRARGAPARPLTAGGLAGAAAMLLPLAVAALVADSTLGSYAASKRLAARGVDVAALAELDTGEARRASFLALAASGDDPELDRRHGIRPGERVRLVGFVATEPEAPGEPLELGRFYVTCCVADAVPVTVPVALGEIGATAPERDRWLEVTGTIARIGDGYGIRAERLVEVREPRRPYLGFT